MAPPHERPIVAMPPWLGYVLSRAIGGIMGDIFVTKEEIAGLMADTLHVSGALPTGNTRLSDWARQHANILGRAYFNELARRVPGGA